MTQSVAALTSMNQTMTRLQTLMAAIEPQVNPFILSATQLSDRIGDLIEKQSHLGYQTQWRWRKSPPPPVRCVI
jgi:hypothetical protein